LTLDEALRDSNLFARHFRKPSWAAWKTFLRALFAASPQDDDLAVYRARTGRAAWPTLAFSEAALIVGRRGGKSRILALVAVYLACFRDYGPYLAPGEVATVVVLAVDKAQARAIFRFVHGLIQAVPLLEPLIVRRDSETIELANRVVIEIGVASFRSTRGYSYAAVLADELAFWRSDESSLNPDVEILRALRPGLASIPGAMLMLASSPYAKRGELYAAFRRHYGKDDGRVLVWKASTAEMNPSIDPAIIAEAYESDPEAARAEFGAEFRDDLADYISREVIDSMTMWGRSELPPEPGIIYSAFCDPSGGLSDAMTLAIGHLDRRNVCVLDALIDIRPPFDPEQAVARCATLLRRYGVATVTGDKYAGAWPVARFAEHGIAFEQSARPKSDLYGDLLPLLNARRVELLDLPRLSAELAGLERRTARSGRDSIDHAPGAHDDLANACAGCLVQLDLDRRPPLVRLGDVTDDGKPPALPTHCHVMFAVVVAVEADVAVVYAGSRSHMPPLWVLDVEAGPYYGGFFRNAAQRLDELTAQCGVRWPGYPPAIFASADLVRHVENLRLESPGLLICETPEWFDAEQSLLVAAEIVASRRVSFTAPVVEKMKIQEIGAALAFKAGDAVETALRAALIASICLKYDEKLKYRPRKAG
jgi:hypothetical protein